MIVGIDIGSQSVKAVACDARLSVLGEASRGYAVTYPRPGWAEQAPALWEDALGPAIAEALDRAGRTPQGVRALGLAGQLDGAIAVDDGGRALGPCLIWTDKRAEAEMTGIPAAEIRRRSGVVPDPSHMAAKIRWLLRHDEAAKGARYFHQPVSYLVARLTGEHVIDHGHASTTMLYALADRDWDDTLLDAFGIDRARLPRIAESYARAGVLTADGAAITGLPAGLPVAVGTGDDFSNPLGAGLVAPGRMACCLGTAEVPGALDNEPKIDDTGLLQTLGYPTGHFFIENPGWLSGGAVKWAADILGIADFARFDALAASVPPGADGVTFLPALAGTTAPEWVASARGCFYGLSAAHGTGHLARAVLEGCAFAMRDVADRLAEMAVPIDSILLLGGGARSAVWAQMRADLTGLPVDVPPAADSSPLGAAVLASVAAGVHADVATAAAGIAGDAARFLPDPATKPAYDAAYGAYRRLFDCLKPMFAAGEDA